MIKRLFVIAFLLCVGFRLTAQVYGNEWINYSQKHYRISIPKTGLYRIDSITMANAGIPLGTLDPKNFQLFIKGQEQYIYVKGESDNVFNSTDYIEFYAEKNDCRFDSAAYYNILRLPNPYVALYNDTNYAYITWNASITNKRVIPETDTAFTGYTPADYFYADRVTSFSSHYSTGNIASTLLEDPRNIEGEGFGVSVPMGQTVSSNPSQLVYQSSSLPAYLQVSYSGSSLDPPSGANYDHHIRVSYYDNTGNTVTLNDTTFYGYKQFLIEKQVTSDQLQNNSFVSVTNVNDPALSSIAGNQKNTTHYIRIRYPQKTDFGGASEQVFYVDDAVAPKSFLNIASVLTLTHTPIFYDLTNHKYISVITASGGAKILVPNSGSQKKCLLTNSSNVINVGTLVPVNQSGYFVNYTATHPDSAYLIVTHKKFINAANAYKNYRQGINGGLNNVVLADVDDLYDQFAYGNKKNPLAIRNFCKFLVDSLPTAPKYLLLIGKSIKNDEVRSGGSGFFNWDSCYVPTMGRPSSDNLFTCGFKGTSSVVPYIPTGRISAKTEATVYNYLTKVTDHEWGLTQTDTLGWRKRVLHFAGGINSGQQASFESYLSFQAGIISDTLFGGKVYTFKKTTTAPIQINISDSVKRMIDYGCSIINFFGHGSTTGFDQSIDDPNVYSNKYKYPLFIANSCYSGNIHLPDVTSSSENFTLIKDKGSIGFIASSSTGVESELSPLTSELYRSLGYFKYYKGIGDALKNSCYYNSFTLWPLREISCLEMTLEGDPYVRLNAFALPDYEIHNSSISFNTASYPDSIGININIRNLGKAIKDTFIVKVERTFPTGNTITFSKQVKAPFHASVLSFFIPKDFENGIGLNHFSVNIDFFNTIGELSETNNSTNGTVDLFIPGGDVIPVYPYKYAIIPNTSQITLKATTADPFAPTANYRIQLDTNDTFQSPFLKSTVVNSIGGVIEWTVNLTEGDSTVYFWRITKDSVAITDRINWRESSFEVYRDKHGWGQSHFHQFKNDAYQFVKFKRSQRRFEFENDTKSLECNNGFLPYVAFDAINYKVNNSLEDYYSCAPGGWNFAIFDSTSARPMEQYITTAGLGSYNNCICNPNYTFKVVSFGSSNFCGAATPNWQDDMRTFLFNIPPNQKILAWSQQNHASQSYSPALRTEFEKFGASIFSNIKDTVPYIIYGTKRPVPVAGTAHEAIGINNRSAIQLLDTLKTRWNNGYIASELIGPSAQWNSLHWSQMPQELPNRDSILIQVIGIKANGTRDTLARFTKDSTDIYDLGHYVNAATHPYIQLVARMSDTLYLTPPQLKKWQVYYDEAPECALNPKKGYTINKTDLQEGEGLVVTLPIENIGALPFTDSLVVTYWIEDKNRVLHYLPQKLKRNFFNPSQVITDTIRFNSYDNLDSNHVDYTGANYLWVDVNPPANARYQREQYHFNNVARIAFNVASDKINPLLDVTFDGAHILNGDIVSAKPHVLVTLKDENKFLALNDTNDFKLYIRYPNQSTDKPLYFSNNALQFTPAQLPSNSCKIEWRPELAEDGKYRLIVQAADRTKNVSGATDYNIQFEVINKETVTEVLNYPNPFSTSTKFVFTLTGSETPDVFIIQIMTITGKVVREITKNELGNLHIGRNITSYAWDGRDDFGDKLANGVYLYRVITRHNGQAMEKRETEADSFFKKGIGKLVIMR
jgi:hypothetical protein